MLPPFSVRAFCGIAGSLFAFALAAGRREKLIPPRDQCLWLLVFAMLNYGLFVVLTTEAPVYLTASEAVTITYTLPIWASILAWPKASMSEQSSPPHSIVQRAIIRTS